MNITAPANPAASIEAGDPVASTKTCLNHSSEKLRVPFLSYNKMLGTFGIDMAAGLTLPRRPALCSEREESQKLGAAANLACQANNMNFLRLLP